MGHERIPLIGSYRFHTFSKSEHCTDSFTNELTRFSADYGIVYFGGDYLLTTHVQMHVKHLMSILSKERST